MDMLEHIRRLFRYDEWANRETIRSIDAAETAPPNAVTRLSHIFAAERLWLHRLDPGIERSAVWPDLTLEQCKAEVETLRELWADYLNRLTPASLELRVDYVNSKGEAWSDTIADILVHVALHSGYHRGQIAADLRAAGYIPAYTDYIQGVRSGSVS